MSLRLVVDNTRIERRVENMSDEAIHDALITFYHHCKAPNGPGITENDRRSIARWFGDTNGNR